MHRTTLKHLAQAMGVALFASVGWLAVQSLGPSEAAMANRPTIHLPRLAPGEFRYIRDPLATAEWPSDLLVLRKPDGHVRVFRIPLLKGLHALPDVHWWKAGWGCKQFVPDFQAGVVACFDPDASHWVRGLAWSLDGQFLGQSPRMDDMVNAVTADGVDGDVPVRR